jgi:lysozyme
MSTFKDSLVPNELDRQKLLAQITHNEGKRPKPYKDTVGKLTIGVGRNLTDVGLSDDEIDYLLINDLKRTENDLDKYLPWWSSLNNVRQRVLLNMCFNMGVQGLLGFRNTLKAIQEHRWSDAKKGMLSSKWASQVGDRAKRLADMMETGK